MLCLSVAGTGCGKRSGYHINADGVTLRLGSVTPMEFRVAQADPGTFEVLATEPEYYAKDKARVYYGAEEIKGCDPKSFQILQSSGMSGDKSHLFQGVRWVSADPDHFELLDAA